MKIKTISTLSSILLLAFSLFCITSCNKDEPLPPIALDVEDHSIVLKYPRSEKHVISIVGGDGNYTASCDKPSVLDVEVSDDMKEIYLTVKSIGEATITITDQSNNSYTLYATTIYIKTQLVIEEQSVVVIGDKLTLAQKKEIEEKAMLTLPAKEGGRYVLIYTNEGDYNKGQAFIYADKNDQQGVETTFEIKEIGDSESLPLNKTLSFIIEGTQREFALMKYNYPSARTGDLFVSISLNELLTNQFKTDYPNVEFVYTQQRITKAEL